jgi:hypothetical protein
LSLWVGEGGAFQGDNDSKAHKSSAYATIIAFGPLIGPTSNEQCIDATSYEPHSLIQKAGKDVYLFTQKTELTY